MTSPKSRYALLEETLQVIGERRRKMSLIAAVIRKRDRLRVQK